MTRNRHPARRGGALAALLLSLLLTLAACDGAASPTAAPASTPTVFDTSTPAAGGAGGTGGPTPTRMAPTPAAVGATATSAALSVAPSAMATPAAATSIVPTTTVAPTATALPTVPPMPPAPTVAAVPRAGQPVRLQIPSIRVDAAIEYVGLTPNGDMDTPKDYDNTAWYELGARPGDIGNAAIAGHVDSKTSKAVFWDLAKLKPGDEIFVVGDDGVTRRFVVNALDSYGRTDAPLQQIFGPTSERHLNIITCDSSTPFSNGHYAANVVVYTTYMP